MDAIDPTDDFDMGDADNPNNGRIHSSPFSDPDNYNSGFGHVGYGQALSEERMRERERSEFLEQKRQERANEANALTRPANPTAMALDDDHIGRSPTPALREYLKSPAALNRLRRHASDNSHSSGFTTDTSQGQDPPATRSNSPAPPGLSTLHVPGRNNRHISLPPTSRSNSFFENGSGGQRGGIRSRSAAPEHCLSPRAIRIAKTPYEHSRGSTTHISVSWS